MNFENIKIGELHGATSELDVALSSIGGKCALRENDIFLVLEKIQEKRPIGPFFNLRILFLGSDEIAWFRVTENEICGVSLP